MVWVPPCLDPIMKIQPQTHIRGILVCYLFLIVVKQKRMLTKPYANHLHITGTWHSDLQIKAGTAGSQAESTGADPSQVLTRLVNLTIYVLYK